MLRRVPSYFTPLPLSGVSSFFINFKLFYEMYRKLHRFSTVPKLLVIFRGPQSGFIFNLRDRRATGLGGPPASTITAVVADTRSLRSKAVEAHRLGLSTRTTHRPELRLFFPPCRYRAALIALEMLWTYIYFAGLCKSSDCYCLRQLGLLLKLHQACSSENSISVIG